MNMQMAKLPTRRGQLALALVATSSLALVSVSHGFWQQNAGNLLNPQMQQQPDVRPAFGMVNFARTLDELARRR